MAVLKCKMCGAQLNINEEQQLAECEYCGSVQTVPKLDDELKLKMFERANDLRARCEFDQAATLFQGIIMQFPEEAEAYWGLVLCKYGIEYVDDTKTTAKIPTCHRTQPKSILDDEDYLTACEYAGVTKWVYEKEAAEIDRIQKRILDIVRTEKPYDIFICYKETDDTTKIRTEDSSTAQDIYTELIKEGYRVFYSRISLRDKAGSEYEPYIYAALSSAKVMLVLGSKTEYFTATWLKNEWSRYLNMLQNGNKTIIPCFEKISADKMPKELKRFEALDMSSKLFFTDLLKNIERLLPKQATVQSVNVTHPAQTTTLDKKELNFDNGSYIGEAIGNKQHGYGIFYYSDGDRYEGNWNLGNPHGLGTFYYAEGKTWVGEFKDNKFWNGNGYIKEYVDGKFSGEYYEGHYENGKRNGKGTYYYNGGNRYEGEWLDDLTNGNGTFYYADGSSWSGEFKDNKRWTGDGTVKFLNDGKFTGEYYVGHYECGKRNGKGINYFAKGNRYDGEWLDNLMQGKGTYYYKNGNRYEGELRNNLSNGNGTFYYADGTSWSGEFKDDKRWTGDGVLKFYKDGVLTGEYYDGHLENGKRNGNGINYYADGEQYDGEWLNDKRHGNGTHYYADGTSWFGEYKDDIPWNGKGILKFTKLGTFTGEYYNGYIVNGKRNGKGTNHYVSGSRYEGNWVDDKKQGEGTYYYADGTSWFGEFKDNDFWHGDGTVKYFSSGNHYEGHYENGKRNGNGVYHFKSGQYYTGVFRDDQIFNGEYYGTNGKLISIYKNGKEHSGIFKKLF